MKPRVYAVFAVLAALFASLFSPIAWGHPVSLSEATVNMFPDRLEVSMRIMVEDLTLYYELESDAEYYIAPQDILDTMEVHKQFMLQFFTLYKEDGTKLEGEITKMVPPENMGEKGVHISELMAHYIDYKAVFPVDGKLDFITVLQEFGGADSWVPASMWLTLLREGELYYPPFTLTKGIPNSVRIDWEKPPIPPASQPEEREKWFQEQSEAVLGFTSYSAVYSFIYITEQEVRHEILMPLMTLESWLPLDRAEPDFIEVGEQDAAFGQIQRFFAERAPVQVDGATVSPTLSRLDFYGLNFSDFAQQAPKQKLNVISARVGAILSYPTQGIPESVDIQWELFNEYMPMLFSMVYAFDQNQQHVFTWESPGLKWENPGVGALPMLEKLPPPEGRETITVPLYAAICIVLLAFLLTCVIMLQEARRVPVYAAVVVLGAGAYFLQPYGMVEVPDYTKPAQSLDEATAAKIVEALQKNIYTAFDYKTESDVYDALAQSVDGELLTDLYLQVRSSLAMQEQGGAISQVEKVTFTEGTLGQASTSPGGAPGFGYTASWTVEGTVEHWGHIHTRTNGYQARFQVEAVDYAWKITGLEMLDEHRIGFKTRLRTLTAK